MMAMFSTSCAVILIIVGASSDISICESDAHHPAPQFKQFFLAFGTFMFIYGGHAAFPTIQHDMKKPYEFNWSVILAFSSKLFEGRIYYLKLYT